MKNMRKLASLLLALALVLSLSVTAFAGTLEITGTTNSPTEGHEYRVYQIFKADIAVVNDEYVLSNVKYGENYTPGDVKVDDDVPDEVIKSITDAEAFAETLHNGNLIEGDPIATLNKDNKFTKDLPDGYYLVADSIVGDTEHHSAHMVRVVGNVSMAPKSGTTTIVKKVDDHNDSTETTDELLWQDSADHDIGDKVPFKIEVTVEDNASMYDAYILRIFDTMEKGLTFNDDIVISVNDKVIEKKYYSVSKTNDPTFTISFDDILKAGIKGGDTIVVRYSATLNNDAVLGSLGNKNTAQAEFSNNPGTDEMGKTVEDTVIVFSYKTWVHKIDEKQTALPGAEFALYKYTLEQPAEGKTYETVENGGYWVATSEPIKTVEGTKFEFRGLDDGKYKIVETKTPNGYNTVDPIVFTVTAEHEILSDDPRFTSLSGEAETGEITFKYIVGEGCLSTTVVNKAGITLPETGGMGTTMIYVVGGILVLAAVVLLVTKKRMANAE